MDEIRILYHIKHSEARKPIENIICSLENRNNVHIDMKFVNERQMTERLLSNPNYQFVIIHLGEGPADECKRAYNYRRITNAILVGESSAFPKGKSDVVDHFHEYIPLIYKQDNLEILLKQYGFLN